MKTKQLILLLLLLLASIPYIYGQDGCTLTGTVVSEKGEPLVGVNLQVKGSYDGTTTDVDGTYTFRTSELGEVILIANYFGYQNIETKLILEEGELRHDLTFTKQTIELDEIVVSDVQFVRTNEKAKATVMSSIDILSTAVDGNVQSAFQMQSGVQPAGEASGLFIRGGAGRESQTFVDGMLVDDFNYSSPGNMAGASRFSPNMFKSSYLSTGGFSAQYGQAISGALILDTKDLPTRSSADLGISPLFVEGGGERLNRKGNVAFGGSAKYQNLGVFLRLMPSQFEFTDYPVTLESTAHLKWSPGAGKLLKVFGSVGRTSVGTFRPNIDRPSKNDHTSLENDNVFSQATYRQEIDNRWTLHTGVGYGRRDTRTRLGIDDREGGAWQSQGEIDETSSLAQVRAKLSYRKGNNTIDVGAESQYREDIATVNGTTGRLNDHYSAAFAETSRQFASRIVGRIGARLEYSDLSREVLLQPRATLSYLLNRQSQFFATYGTFAQRAETRYLQAAPGLSTERAEHFILGYHRNSNERSFRIEAYAKQYSQLLRLQPDITTSGSGYARGVEVFFRDRTSIKNTDYWLTYSFVDAERDYLNFPRAAQPTFAARHVANVAIKHFVPAIMTNFGATYTYSSGRTYYNPNRPDSEFLADRTPGNHNINLNIAYLPRMGKTFSVIVLTLYNALNFRQLYGYEYGTADITRRRAIVPSTDRYAFLGLFVNFGIDRTDDLINRQLNN